MLVTIRIINFWWQLLDNKLRIVVSTPCLRERVMKCLRRGQKKERVHTQKVKVVVDGGIEMTRKAEI